MDARNEALAPSSDLIQEEDCKTLLLYLPRFTKDQLRVQLTRTRVLKISGTNKSSSFQDFPVPENCDTEKITAKFEDGILYVRQPKTKTQLQSQKPATDDHIRQAAEDKISGEEGEGSSGKKEEKKPTHDRRRMAQPDIKGAGTEKLVESSPAVKQKMRNVVLLLFVFALAIFLTKLPSFSNRPQD